MQSAAAERSRTLNTLFAGYGGPAFALRLWDGWSWTSSANERAACTIVVRDPKALRSLVWEADEISLGEAFIHRDLEVEGDLFSVFSLSEHLFHRPVHLSHKLAAAVARAFRDVQETVRNGLRHSEQRDRASIAYHYDQPLAFYRP